ncbi:hypothetical protein JHD50_00020 [Sulfurimonas sp. MAG313]|nr:immunoglobulin-like domain-containing protein [Sulfurimonas sp. MAG313]MDF1879700.1 hypothetical protein [Sulfurimonas sp. MAG313]
MAYSNDDIESTYEALTQTSSETKVWNARSVYFDNEVVEYQGKSYIALDKTCAEVPGRSNKWKEYIVQEDKLIYETDTDLYEDIDYSLQNRETIKAKNIPVNKTSLPSNKKVMPKMNTPLKTDKKPIQLKTLKEQKEEKLTREEPRLVERKMQERPSEQSLVNSILKTIDFKKIKGFNADDNTIIKNLILPQTQDEYKLVWESSHKDIISSKGEVKRPIDGQDIAVNLSLTVHLNKVSSTRFFTLWVKALEQVLSDEECVKLVYEALSFEHIRGLNEKATMISSDLALLTHGLHETQIFWASRSRELLDESGHFHKKNLNKNTKIRLYAIIVKGSFEKLKSFDLTLKV